jgi:hypothetical protein
MTLKRWLMIAAALASFRPASYAGPIQTVMCSQPTPAIDVGANPKYFELMVMFTSPIANPTRIFTRYANTKNTEFRIEKMTGPFDGCAFGTIAQPVQGELQHTITINDAGGKGIKQGDKISFTLLAAAPMGSMFETRDTDPSTPSKDFRIRSGSNAPVDINLNDITFTVTQVPEPAPGPALCAAVLIAAALQRLSTNRFV